MSPTKTGKLFLHWNDEKKRANKEESKAKEGRKTPITGEGKEKASILCFQDVGDGKKYLVSCKSWGVVVKEALKDAL